MPDKRRIIGVERDNIEKGFQNEMEYSSTGRLERNDRRPAGNSLPDTEKKQGRTRANSMYALEGKKNGTLKNVSFNMDLNEYFEPRQNCLKQRANPLDCVKERRNGISIIKRDSYEVLRILSMYTSWRLAQAQKGRKYEQFADFLARASPKLFDKFFIDNQSLL